MIMLIGYALQYSGTDGSLIFDDSLIDIAWFYYFMERPS